MDGWLENTNTMWKCLFELRSHYFLNFYPQNKQSIFTITGEINLQINPDWNSSLVIQNSSESAAINSILCCMSADWDQKESTHHITLSLKSLRWLPASFHIENIFSLVYKALHVLLAPDCITHRSSEQNENIWWSCFSGYTSIREDLRGHIVTFKRKIKLFYSVWL